MPFWHLKAFKLTQTMFLILTKDLMIQSSASAAARSHGAEISSAPTLDAAIKKMASTRIRALFIDLQTPGLVLADLLARLEVVPDRPTVIAFAQHVEEELLALAKTEVIDKVLTRGQFSHQLPKLIADRTNEDG